MHLNSQERKQKQASKLARCIHVAGSNKHAVASSWLQDKSA